jgi:hypothetical protein
MSLRGEEPVEDTRKSRAGKKMRERKNNAQEADASGSPQIRIGQKKLARAVER